MLEPALLPLGLVNAYLLRGDKAVLVDAGYPGSEERVLSSLARVGVDPAGISLIVVTHAHLDHYGSATALRSRLRVPVACSRADSADMACGVNRHLEPVGPTGRIAAIAARAAAGSRSRAAAAALEPDILFSGPVSLAPWGVDASVVPTPGHTPGSVSIVPGAGSAALWVSGASLGAAPPAFDWAIVGDLAFGRFTAPRRARLPIFAADLAGVAANLRRFSGTRAVLVGHGGPLRGSDLARLAERLGRGRRE